MADPMDLLSLGMAAGVCDSRYVGLSVALDLAAILLSAGVASQNQRRRTTDDSRRQTGDSLVNGAEGAAQLACAVQAAANLGGHHCQGLDRSSVVFCDGLVSHLPGSERH